MPWVNDFQEFYYSKRLLQTIAENYSTLYDVGLPSSNTSMITNLFALAEYKADFDMALSAIGKGKWQDITSLKPSDYKGFGKLQMVVIADILCIDDYELEGLGFYNISRLRGYAYSRMAKYLNGISLYSNLRQFKSPSETQFITNPKT